MGYQEYLSRGLCLYLYRYPGIQYLVLQVIIARQYTTTTTIILYSKLLATPGEDLLQRVIRATVVNCTAGVEC